MSASACPVLVSPCVRVGGDRYRTTVELLSEGPCPWFNFYDLESPEAA